MPRTTYDFTLETQGRSVLDEEVFDALHEAGCDDALIGRLAWVEGVAFTREADSYCEAIGSAIEDVESVPGVAVAQVVADDENVPTADEVAGVNAMLSSRGLRLRSRSSALEPLEATPSATP